MDKIVMCHGDVTLYETNAIPKTAKKVKWEKGFIIEKGEGIHTHTIENDCDIYVDETTGRMYFQEKKEKIRINHEEHGIKTIPTKTGIVYKDIEQEFSYENMESRNTRD